MFRFYLAVAAFPFLAACASLNAVSGVAASTGTPEARVAHLLRAHPLVDGHNDLMGHYHACGKACPRGLDDYDISARAAGDTDIPRWRAGGVGAQLLNAGWREDEPGLEGTLKGVAFARALVARHPEDLALAMSAEDARRHRAQGRIAVLLALEDPGRLGRDEATVRRLSREGVRANVLAYSGPTDFADGHAGPARHGGLSPDGVAMVGWMERAGMLVDLSHASADTARDVLDVARAPVIFSHSNAAALADVPRNVPDDVLRRLPANGGVVMVGFVPYFASKEFADWMARGDAYWDSLLRQHGGDREKASGDMARWEADHPPPRVGIADIADHIDHIRKVAGVDHVGIGADFDGIAFKVDGLEDVSRYPNLLVELARRGWRDDELAKLAGGNFLRVLQVADRARAALESWSPTAFLPSGRAPVVQ